MPPLRWSSIAPPLSAAEPYARFNPLSEASVSAVRTMRSDRFPECASALTSAWLPTGVQSAGNPWGFNSSNDPFVQGLAAADADSRHEHTAAQNDENNMARVLQRKSASGVGQSTIPRLRRPQTASQRQTVFADEPAPDALWYAPGGKSRKHVWVRSERERGQMPQEESRDGNWAIQGDLADCVS